MPDAVCIEGEWKVVGSTFPNSSGKSWTNGTVALRHTSIGWRWVLCNKGNVIKRLHASLNSTLKIVGGTSKRIIVKTPHCSFESFIIVPSNQTNIQETLGDIRSALTKMQNSAGGKLTASEALKEISDDYTNFSSSSGDEIDWPAAVRRANAASGNRRHAINEYSPVQSPSSPMQKTSFYGKSPALRNIPTRTKLSCQKKLFTPLLKTTRPVSSSDGTTPSPISINTSRFRSSPLLAKSRKPHEETLSGSHNDVDDVFLVMPMDLSGFRNLGNTCYMNAVIQSLLSLDPFTTELHSSYTEFQCNLEEKSLLKCLAELSLCKRGSTFDSNRQMDLLKNLASVIRALSGKYIDFRQHDAHEFLCDLLDLLKEEVTTTISKTSIDSSISLKNKFSINPVTENFEFKLVNKLQCESCGSVTEVSETQHDIAVNLPKVEVIDNSTGISSTVTCSIQDALDRYFQAETVDCLCNSCGHTKAISSQSFSSLPRLLVIVVQRSDNRYAEAKANRRLVISSFITLAKHCPDNVTLASSPSQPVKLYQLSRSASAALASKRTPPKEVLLDDTEDKVSPRAKNSCKQTGNTNTGNTGVSRDNTNLYQEHRSVEKTTLKRKNPNDRFVFKRLHHNDSNTREETKVKEQATVNDRDSMCGLEDMSEEDMIKVAIARSLRDVRTDSPVSECVFTSGTTSRHKLSEPIQSDSYRLKGGTSTSDCDLDCYLVEKADTDEHYGSEKENIQPQPKACYTGSKERPDDRGDDSYLSRNDPYYRRLLKHSQDGEVFGYSYALVGVISHLGSSSSYGHYVSDTYNVQSDVWLSYDDANVTFKSRDEVLQQREKTSYVFYYMDKMVLEDLEACRDSH